MAVGSNSQDKASGIRILKKIRQESIGEGDKAREVYLYFLMKAREVELV